MAASAAVDVLCTVSVVSDAFPLSFVSAAPSYPARINGNVLH